MPLLYARKHISNNLLFKATTTIINKNKIFKILRKLTTRQMFLTNILYYTYLIF